MQVGNDVGSYKIYILDFEIVSREIRLLDLLSGEWCERVAIDHSQCDVPVCIDSS